MEKLSRIPIKARIKLVVLEALVGKILYRPLMGCITNPRSPGWTNTLEAQTRLWLELLVLEALVGTNDLDPWKAWVETNLVLVWDFQP